ncbi:hypothetical protein GCM10025867_48340 (plasmid) [Frondihabitans sucicola]|uniref:Uncharacterized protein n=1 Tax=Frondihabitans sucicola TaxID=1268041 RepID=A0ABM8GW02_9MICO|nr:hypothetical protein [Frondihabitans sucicola]BDZ52593.1 hypothetical protein GCM10025867_48340 [Frondihabitans sucicola]
MGIVREEEDAADMEPLSITVNMLFGREDAELAKLTKDVFGYGRGTRLDLPEQNVHSLVYDGPADWFSGTESGYAVSVIPVRDAHQGEPARIDSYAADGTHLGGLTGTSTDVGNGTEGGFIEVSFEEVLSMFWRFPRDSLSGSTDMTFDAVGRSGVAVNRVVRFMDTLPRAQRLRLTLSGKSVSAALPQGADLRAADPKLSEYAEDLSVIEKLGDVTFAFPQELPEAAERIWTRIARMLLEGKCALIPNYSSMKATLSGSMDEGLMVLLDAGGAILNRSVSGEKVQASTCWTIQS